MTQFLFRLYGPAVLTCLSLTAGMGHAATLGPDTLADLTRVDVMGNVCVDEVDLDEAFARVGKKIGVPQTCLPDPCLIQADRAMLGQALGRDPSEDDWDRYMSEYADTCVAEVTPYDDDVMFANASDVLTDFFDGYPGEPIVLNSGVGSNIVENIGTDDGLPRGTFLVGGLPGNSGVGSNISTVRSNSTTNRSFATLPSIPSIGGSTTQTGDTITNVTNITIIKNIFPGATPDPENPEPGDNMPSPAPVPLPGAMVLLLGAFGATAGLRTLGARRPKAT